MRTFSFNGIKKKYLIPLFGFNREPWAPVEREYQDIRSRPGVYMRSKRIVKQRTFSIPVVLHDMEMDYNKLKEDLATWLIHDEAKPLIFDDEPNRIYFAVIDGSFSPDDIVTFGKGTLTFVCPSPYKYGFEDTIPIGDYPIINDGNVKTPPILTMKITSPSSTYSLNNGAGKNIKLTYPFKTNDIVVVDMDKRKIIINGSLQMQTLDLYSEFFDLMPGENRVLLSENATATVTFRPMWM